MILVFAQKNENPDGIMKNTINTTAARTDRVKSSRGVGLLFSGLPWDRFLTYGPNPAGLSYRGTSAGFYVGDPATTRRGYIINNNVFSMSCTGSGNHGGTA